MLFTLPAAWEWGKTHLLEMSHFSEQTMLRKCWIWVVGEVSGLKEIADLVSDRKLS